MRFHECHSDAWQLDRIKYLIEMCIRFTFRYKLPSHKHIRVKINMEHNHRGLVQIIFLSRWVICRFHVNLPGCIGFRHTIRRYDLMNWNVLFFFVPYFAGIRVTIQFFCAKFCQIWWIHSNLCQFIRFWTIQVTRFGNQGLHRCAPFPVQRSSRETQWKGSKV